MTADTKTKLELLEKLRPLDDTFIRSIFSWCSEEEKRELTEWILHAILSKEDIRITSAESQKDMKQAAGIHSVLFDLFAGDDKETLYDVEFQKGIVHKERILFYSYSLGIHGLAEGEDYERLRKFSMIFITDPRLLKGVPDSIFKKGPVTEWSVSGPCDGPDFPSTGKIILVDATYNGNDALGDMLQDLRCSRSEEIRQPTLKRIACDLKYTKEGCERMCELMEQYAEKRAAQAAAEAAAEAAAKTRMKGIQATVRKCLAHGFTDMALIADLAGCSLTQAETIAREYRA